MFLVTDVTGHVAKAVVAELAQHGLATRVLAPETGDASALPPSVEIVHCNPADSASLKRAAEGVEAVFVSCPFTPQVAAEQLRFTAAAQAAGVKRIVQLSGVGADASMCCARMLRWYGEAESNIAATGLAITRLRPTIQFQMLLEFAPSVVHQGLIAGPFRSTRWTWVDARDVGAIAVAALREPGHADKTYTVTGSESVSFHDVAERLGRVLGKSIRYNDITANEARGWLQAKGVSPVMIEAKLELWDACASNLINVAPTSVVREVTGREPRSLEEFAADYRVQFGV